MGRRRSEAGLPFKALNWLRDTWVRILTLAILLAICGCDTKNIGLENEPIRGPIVTVTVPADMFGWVKANWAVSWIGGTAPYTLSWNMGGGAHENTLFIQDAVSPQSQKFCMVDDLGASVFTYTVTVTDALGQIGSSSGSYILNPTRNSQPRIDRMTFEDGILTVYASDNDDPRVSVTVTPGSNFIVDQGNPNSNTKTIGPPFGEILEPCSGGVEGLVTFSLTLSADYLLLGASDDVLVYTDDGNGGSDMDSILITIDPKPLEPDTLYAFAWNTGVEVDDPVRIQIVTGETIHPFHFMLGVGIVLDEDAEYVSDSFNVGAVGGARDDADGVWSDITVDAGFILGPDVLIMPGADPADLLGTSNRFDFNISPLGGTDVASVEGELFNFQVAYSSAGEKQISFQEFNGVNRTYYSDMATGEIRHWGAYVEGTITVAE